MAALLLALAGSTARLDAHHGAAAYDLSETKSFDAVIVEFRWMNPHALVEFDAADGSGTHRWTAETAGLTILVRAGWSKTSLQPGMKVTITGHPARNGSPTMILDHVTLADGRTLTTFVPR